MKKIKDLITNFRKEHGNLYSIIMYIIMGGFTTVVNIVSFWLCNSVFGIDYVTSNTVSWIASVIFAYATNKRYVFESYTPTWKDRVREASSFFGFRFLTYLVDLAVMVILISGLGTNALLAKILTNVIVLVLNYVFSKWIIFKIRK
ncbi:GtrA family protein [Listeria booriae]|uniref:GtrA family protein n=1 Tax=Listeria booriae TaxID=1552123 RepID=A0A7X0XXR3_9LIST|nr:GtrA family protein [Listeria booriae]MBC1210072.1 GtrA family protein [Listeria booriae]MBC1229328.1 GtrA family protein [Listeria booriae]MBC1232546.1 GtrA family protein [Listeria booriae]MBC1246467.1 GtrA family protein [Listeria booriae]MBC1273181.1 GtrA family protein [Listeria booriae]